MNINEITNERENKLFNFIEKINSSEAAIREKNEIKESLDNKLWKLNKSTDQCKDEVTKELFGRLFVDAVPLDDTYKDSNEEVLKRKASQYIDNKGGLLYIKEGLNKYKSAKLKQFIEAVDSLAKDFQKEKGVNINSLSSDDLDYHIDDNDKDIDKIEDDLEFNDLSRVIYDNVKRATLKEIDTAREEEERIKALELELSADEDVSTESALNNKLLRKGMLEMKKVYEPSLFEAVLAKNFKHMNENGMTRDDAFAEAICEFTLMHIENAFKINDYNNIRIKKATIDSYLRG